MSTGNTLSIIDYEIRQLTGDVDRSDFQVSSFAMRIKVNNALHDIASEVFHGSAWTAAALSLVANTYDYSLQTGTPYGSLLAIKLDSTGELLEKVAPDTMEQDRTGNPVSTGTPTRYAIIESTAQTTKIRLFPTPKVADSISTLSANVPTDFVLSTSSSILSVPLEKALQLRVAAECVAGFSSDVLQKLQKSKDEAKLWLQQAERLILNEKYRVSRLRRGTTRGVYPSWAGIA